jgi:hypothetical protein
MNLRNLAMVFAPNLLRCPSELPSVIFENARWEQKLVCELIENLNTGMV